MSGSEHLKVGQDLTITLDGAIPSSGYVWISRGMPEGLELVDEFFQNQDGANYTGGSGTQSFVIKANLTGLYGLYFDLTRPWEPDPIKTYFVQVKVT